MPTFKKLEILNKKKGLPKKDFNKISKYKQKITSTILKLPTPRDLAKSLFKLETRNFDPFR